MSTPGFHLDQMSSATDPAKRLAALYPVTLPLEIAMRMQPVQEICASYGIDHAEWEKIKSNPLFVKDLHARIIELRTDGVNFHMKAKLQAESLLEKSYRMIHQADEEVPPLVKQKLIDMTIRAAGLDRSRDQASGQSTGGAGNALQINFHMGP